MKKTLIVWRRLGKEHGENQGFRPNPPEVVDAHIRGKLDAFRQTSEDDWRWYQISDDLFVEKGGLNNGTGHAPMVYYLPKRNWVLADQPRWTELGTEWRWLVHIGEMALDQHYGCWVFTDLFVDVVVQRDNVTHHVIDLDDLSTALEMGLVDAPQTSRILRATQELVNLIRAGEFPPNEVRECR